MQYWTIKLVFYILYYFSAFLVIFVINCKLKWDSRLKIINKKFQYDHEKCGNLVKIIKKEITIHNKKVCKMPLLEKNFYFYL